MRSICVLFLLLASCMAAPEPEAREEELALPLVYQDIDLGGPDYIHTTAVYQAGARFRSDRHVVLMIPGTLANGAGYYDISAANYNAARILARAGFIVGLIDLPGTGESVRPADGSVIDTPAIVEAVRRVSVRYRLSFWTASVSVYGETGVGTNVGLLLAREPWLRSFVGSAMFYREFGSAVASTLFNPGFRGFVASIPGGYAPQDPGFIGGFFGAADPAVQAEATTACVGPAPYTVPTGPLLELFAIPYTTSGTNFVLDYPIVDAAPARAPALFIQGSPDDIGSENGTNEMAAVYGSTGGGDATVIVLPGASHLMRFDSAISNGPSSTFWSEVIGFLSAH